MGLKNPANIKVFEIIEDKEYLTLSLLRECESHFDPVLEKDLDSILENQPRPLIVNCEKVMYLSPEWIRFLLKSQQKLKALSKSVRYISLRNEISQQLKKDGLDLAFISCGDLKTALIQVGVLNPVRLDTEFINPFLSATIDVLKVLAHVEAIAGKPYLKKSGEKFTGDISGVIGIVSESFSGSVIISFPEKTFISFMNSMLDEKYTEINPDILDGAGEITNQVFGKAKVTLNEKGFGIKAAIPSVVSGKDHTLLSICKGPTVVIPFSCDEGKFFVEISITS